MTVGDLEACWMVQGSPLGCSKALPARGQVYIRESRGPPFAQCSTVRVLGSVETCASDLCWVVSSGPAPVEEMKEIGLGRKRSRVVFLELRLTLGLVLSWGQCTWRPGSSYLLLPASSTSHWARAWPCTRWTLSAQVKGRSTARAASRQDSPTACGKLSRPSGGSKWHRTESVPVRRTDHSWKVRCGLSYLISSVLCSFSLYLFLSPSFLSTIYWWPALRQAL